MKGVTDPGSADFHYFNWVDRRAAFSTQMLWQLEGGKGTRSKAVHFQLRPDPWAR